jgi:phosphoadenosine phosphosulfate reductase
VSLVWYNLMGEKTDKVETTIKRLQMFEPEEGFFVAFGGGKDSTVVYYLCKLAGVKFDAHYSMTSVDPPELVRFIKDQFPDVIFDTPRDENGKVITMWNLIPRKLMPPTRIVRYCCEAMKECSGKERVTVTGVRWAESQNRKLNQGLVTIATKSKKIKKELTDAGINFLQTKRGGVVLNDDNDEARRMVEQCYRTHKTLVNPIIDWTTEDVWEFLNDVVKAPHCCLYDEGFARLGCIGCPMSSNQEKEFERWPKYRDMYLRAFERMLAERNQKGLKTDWKTAEEVMEWWLSGKEPEQDENQISMFEGEE